MSLTQPFLSRRETHIWPNNIRKLEWPSEGITFSYEQRGYIAPEKIEHWLIHAFGPGNGKYVVSVLRLCLWGEWDVKFGEYTRNSTRC
jgi:hypothetical protein